jgi:hypothetical protein
MRCPPVAIAVAAIVVGALASGSMTPATAAPASARPALLALVPDVISVKVRKRHRTYYVPAPAPPLVPYGPLGPLIGPYAQGFRDPGFAYHGNVPSCAVDLGYGRYETCSTPSR